MPREVSMQPSRAHTNNQQSSFLHLAKEFVYLCIWHTTYLVRPGNLRHILNRIGLVFVTGWRYLCLGKKTHLPSSCAHAHQPKTLLGGTWYRSQQCQRHVSVEAGIYLLTPHSIWKNDLSLDENQATFSPAPSLAVNCSTKAGQNWGDIKSNVQLYFSGMS